MTSADVRCPHLHRDRRASGNSTAVGAIVQTPTAPWVLASYDPNIEKELPDGHRCRRKASLSAALPGATVGDPLTGPGGKLYQQTFDDDAQTTYINVVAPDGTTMSAAVPGVVTGKIVIDPTTGKAFLTSTVTPPAQIPELQHFRVRPHRCSPVLGPPPRPAFSPRPAAPSRGAQHM